MNTKIGVIKPLEYMYFTVVFTTMFMFIARSPEQQYQVHRDILFYKGIIFFFIGLIPLIRVNLKKWYVWTIVFSVSVGMLVYFKMNNIAPSTYGEDYFRFVAYRLVAMTVFFLEVAWLIVKKIKDRSKISFNLFTFVTIIVFFICFYEGKETIPCVCPTLLILLLDVEKEKWARLVDIFAASYYVSFGLLMTYSLITEPYREQEGRYLGNFLNVGSAGMFTGGAFVCALYFISKWILNKCKPLYTGLFYIVLIIYPAILSVKIASRGAELGIGLSTLLFIILYCGKKDKYSVLRRVIVAFFVLALSIIGILVFFKNEARKIENKEITLEGKSYIYRHFIDAVFPDDENVYFSDSSVLNMLDYFSSERVRTWAEYLKMIELHGKDIPVLEFSGDKAKELLNGINSTHNFLLHWLIKYGIIGGIPLLFWLLLYIENGIVGTLHNENASIMAILWVVYFIGAGSFITVGWKYPIVFMLIILMYSFMLEKERKHEIEK